MNDNKFTQFVGYELDHNKDLKKEVKNMLREVREELGQDKKYIAGEVEDRLKQIFEDYKESENCGNLNTILASMFDNFLTEGLQYVNWKKITGEILK